MATWTCATHGPVPADQIRHLDHNSPTGHERHECGSSAGLDWTKTKEHDMTTTPTTANTYGLVDIQLASKDRTGCLPAQTFGEHVTPGLAITPGIGGNDTPMFTGGWILTHLGSGMHLNGTTQFPACLLCIREFADDVIATGIDWTLTQPELTALIAAGGPAIDLLKKAQMEMLSCGGSTCGTDQYIPGFDESEPAS